MLVTTDGIMSPPKTWRRERRLKLDMMLGDDEDEDDEMSFGAKAARERTHAELNDIISSHNILAFIKVKVDTSQLNLTADCS